MRIERCQKPADGGFDQLVGIDPIDEPVPELGKCRVEQGQRFGPGHLPPRRNGLMIGRSLHRCRWLHGLSHRLQWREQQQGGGEGGAGPAHGRIPF